jgi:hypothetical protein
MQDRFVDHARSLQGPADHGFAIVPHDAADLVEVARALYVGGAGSVRVVTASGAELTLAGVASGSVLPVRVRRVLASGTTATALVGLV